MRYKYTVVREMSQREDKREIQVHGRERSESGEVSVGRRVKEGSNCNTLTLLALVCPVNLLHHQTSFAHGMYR